MAVESAIKAEAKAAKAGARAGAKARARESSENESAIVAAVRASKTGKATTWSYGYRAGTNEDGTADHREVTVWERGRRDLQATELLSRTNEAARLAAAQIAKRHGVPMPGWDEITDLAMELCTRLLAESPHGTLPRRDRLTRTYLVERAVGILMNDPNRRAADGVPDGDVDAADLLGAADTAARAKGSRRDDMLTVPGEVITRKRHGKAETAYVPMSMDPVNPSLRAGLMACELTAKPSRAAAYLIHGGTVADDWSLIWDVSPGYAKTRTVPEGVNALRTMTTQEWADLAAAIATAAAPDRLDRREAKRRDLERGLCPPSDRHRSLKPWRDRLMPGDRIGTRGAAVPEAAVVTTMTTARPARPKVSDDRDLADAELAETRKRRNRNHARRLLAGNDN